jgi:hypothetical protein
MLASLRGVHAVTGLTGSSKTRTSTAEVAFWISRALHPKLRFMRSLEKAH